MTELRLRLRLDLLASSEGGRQTPISDGYRAQWDIGNVTGDGEPMSNDATLRLTEPLAPGESVEAQLVPHVPDLWTGVSPGDELTAREGQRVVARAVVLDIEPSGAN
jgi:translation elongation factor EF-Tu-like GTPase